MTLAPQVTSDEETRVTDINERLRQRFPEIDHQLIVRTVDEAYHQFDDARVRDFVPILVEKRARDLLLQRQC